MKIGMPWKKRSPKTKKERERERLFLRAKGSPYVHSFFFSISGGDITTKGHGDQDVRLLLHQKALVDANGTGVTPLYTAAKHGQTELVKLLLEARADVDT